MARTIQSPGVEIKEHDLSENPSIAIGTYIFTTGFADKGPTDEVLQVTSTEEFEQIFGVPTTPAERYFYHSVTQQFNSPANVLVARLPYGGGTGEGFNSDNKYSVLVYPVASVSSISTSSNTLSSVPKNEFDKGNRFIIQRPYHYEITEEEYSELQEGSLFKWKNETLACDINVPVLSDIGKAGIIIVNKSQTTINDKYEGYYVGISDNIACEPSSKYQSIISTQSINSSADTNKDAYIKLPSTRMNFTLSAEGGSSGNSISQIMEDSSEFSIFGSEFDDTLTFNVFKLRKSLYADSTIKLDANLSESYVASVDYFRQMQSQNGGKPVSFFIESTSENSTDIQVLINPNLSGKKSGKTWLGDNGKPTNKIRVAFSTDNTEFVASSFNDDYAELYGMDFRTASGYGINNKAADALFPIGTYQSSNPETKVLGAIPKKVSRILSKLENRDLFEVDITCEAGLGTIYAYSKAANTDTFDDEFDAYSCATAGNWFKTGQDSFDGSGDSDLLVNYRTIYNIFSNFASNERKDHIFIADPLRFIFLQGANTKTLTNKSRNFSQNIFWPLKYQFMTANTSYAATYANWAKVYDNSSDKNIWVPMSGILATTYANTDSNYYCWYAPAGPDRGILTSVSDIALSPNVKQREQLYKISINPIYQDPNMGFVVFGQKTLQSKPSSFDRINVRRLFLYLEKSTYNTVKWFVFRNNTYSTRMAVTNTLEPIFRSCKNNEGVYDYRIVCNENNNNADVIDANELVVDIYIKAVRTAEFILCNFYSTKTSTNFDELIK